MISVREKFKQPGLWVFLLAFFICLGVMGGHLYSQDEEILYRTADSFSRLKGGAIEPLGGVARIPDGQGGFKTVYQKGFGTRQGAGGSEYAQYGIGQPLLAIPLVWLGRLFALVTPDSLLETLHIRGAQYHDRSVREYAIRYIVSFFNSLVTAGMAWLLYFFAGEIFQNRKAGVGVFLIYLLSTIALPQSRTFFTEPLSGLCGLGSLVLIYQGSISLKNTKGGTPYVWMLSGFLFGFALLTRLDSLMMGPGLGLFVILVLWNSKSTSFREKLECLIRWIIPVAGCVLIIAVLNFIRFGSPMASGYSDQPEGVKFINPIYGLQGFLFSSGRSLFVFSPPLLLAPLGGLMLWKRDRIVALSIGIVVLVFFGFQCTWQNWAGGWDWGPRHIIQLTPFLAVALGGMFEDKMWNKAWKRVPLLLLIIIGIGVNFLGVAFNPISTYGMLPTELHRYTLYDPAFSLPSLHYQLIRYGDWKHLLPTMPDAALRIHQWDPILPRLLFSPALLMRLLGWGILACLGVSGGGLWRTILNINHEKYEKRI